ncbi:hypothetical protein ACIP5Y_26265 [Nocardia sp. NPDC088792]|uniref:hypothetical protein n=1 Tax=Nocardia sp. NPDC088792 TaxID=3364332 RepID=UPI00380959DE
MSRFAEVIVLARDAEHVMHHLTIHDEEDSCFGLWMTYDGKLTEVPMPCGPANGFVLVEDSFRSYGDAMSPGEGGSCPATSTKNAVSDSQDPNDHRYGPILLGGEQLARTRSYGYVLPAMQPIQKHCEKADSAPAILGWSLTGQPWGVDPPSDDTHSDGR